MRARSVTNLWSGDGGEGAENQPVCSLTDRWRPASNGRQCHAVRCGLITAPCWFSASPSRRPR